MLLSGGGGVVVFVCDVTKGRFFFWCLSSLTAEEVKDTKVIILNWSCASIKLGQNVEIHAQIPLNKPQLTTRRLNQCKTKDFYIPLFPLTQTHKRQTDLKSPSRHDNKFQSVVLSQNLLVA